MATNRILSNAKEFVKSLDDAEKALHQRAMLGISDWMEEVRIAAVDKFIVPNNYKNRTAYIKKKDGTWEAKFIYPNGGKGSLSRVQKKDPTRMTTRTGLLAAVISANGTWKANRDYSELKWVKGNSSRVRTIVTDEQDPGQHVLMWVRPQKNGYMSRFTFGKGGKGTQISYRLGRARQRPFLQPAIKATENRFDVTVWRRLKLAANRTI